MKQLEWSGALALDFPLMDDTHREFVDLLAEVHNAPDDTLLRHWAALIDHTDDHFGREDAWMLSTQFASGNCHSMQHKVVLQVMREGLQHGQNGDLKMIRLMAGELALWFPQHAQAMDASLALHMRRVDFDPVTGLVRKPEALSKEMIHGCGGSCSETENLAVEAAAIA
ncbi:MAG: hemerythrin domain-containing protein [Rhodoferax sp.]|uniref:hemerythrin domain-containing protein n=1 Tax=Rhodoferax sp. TaxID=50421 RepID=UPI002716610B|nr:hemerythrin domain-containing protein [Rhodoferax sp.]MDO8447909.1 hemerythrin domain-containing protein [Rhodoferax sp.]